MLPVSLRLWWQPLTVMVHPALRFIVLLLPTHRLSWQTKSWAQGLPKLPSHSQLLLQVHLCAEIVLLIWTQLITCAHQLGFHNEDIDKETVVPGQEWLLATKPRVVGTLLINTDTWAMKFSLKTLKNKTVHTQGSHTVGSSHPGANVKCNLLGQISLFTQSDHHSTVKRDKGSSKSYEGQHMGNMLKLKWLVILKYCPSSTFEKPLKSRRSVWRERWGCCFWWEQGT